jgi:ABC-2 type transport system permease protein
MRSLSPLMELTRVRLLEFVREPEAVFWVFVFPVLLALALGIAFRSRPAQTYRVGVLAGPQAPEVVGLLEGKPGLAVRVVAPGEAARALGDGVVDLIVEEERGDAGRPVFVYRYDPARNESVAARLETDDELQRALGRRDPAEVREEAERVPGSRYIDFLIPGLVGLNLMGSGLWGVGFSVVVARTRKLLKRFAATPMRRSHFLLGYAFSRLAFMVLEVGAILGFGWLVFGVAVRGSLLAVAVLSLVGAMSFSGIGLLVAARPRTVEAVSGWMNLVMLPMWLLSGSFFSYRRFPAVFQPAIRALPLTALNDALRAVIDHGASLGSTWVEVAVMTAWGLASFAVALRIFRWQ